MIVEAKGISKIYSRQGETVTALQDVNLSVGAQERIGIAGGSGSGKSTLLRLLSLQEEPTSGTLSLFGKSTSQWKGNERELYRSLQVMFQNSFHSISPRMAVGEFWDRHKTRGKRAL
ncbi:ATP-binding cassette domain-containing protein [Veillonella sp. 3960]|uniref:ATP-binding cassette domain-containing protein n=1 Tax=Veillonella sp. 3960 TaxID=2490955 RepID=UPI001F0C5E60|nr:ATP-binding cassette domain-containing protein [Veillonella sp. 3960]